MHVMNLSWSLHPCACYVWAVTDCKKVGGREQVSGKEILLTVLMNNTCTVKFECGCNQYFIDLARFLVHILFSLSDCCRFPEQPEGSCLPAPAQMLLRYK